MRVPIDVCLDMVMNMNMGTYCCFYLSAFWPLFSIGRGTERAPRALLPEDLMEEGDREGRMMMNTQIQSHTYPSMQTSRYCLCERAQPS